jgi:hypothetical protein
LQKKYCYLLRNFGIFVSTIENFELKYFGTYFRHMARQPQLLDGRRAGVQRGVGLVRGHRVRIPLRQLELGARAARAEQERRELSAHARLPQFQQRRSSRRQRVQKQIHSRLPGCGSFTPTLQILKMSFFFQNKPTPAPALAQGACPSDCTIKVKDIFLDNKKGLIENAFAELLVQSVNRRTDWFGTRHRYLG